MKIIKTYLFILCMQIIGGTTVAKAESSKELEERVNNQINTILYKEKYQRHRQLNLLEVKDIDGNVNLDTLVNAMNSWFLLLIKRQGNHDADSIDFTPEMLSKFREGIVGKNFPTIDQENVIDFFNSINILILKSGKISDSNKLLSSFVNDRYGVFDQHDMAVYWLDFYLKNSKIAVNCYSSGSLMGTSILNHNSDVPLVLLNHGYRVTERDFETLRNQITMVQEDDGDMYETEKALQALHNIETLMMNSLKNPS